MIDYARKEYERLVRLPFGSAERHYNNRYMAFLRDFIAEAEGRSAEDVQTEYEARGLMDAMNQRVA